MAFDSVVNWETEIVNVKEMGLVGKRMPDIAKHYGLTRQRIEQVIKKHIPDWKDNYGAAVRRKQAADRHFEKWGDRQSTDQYDAQRGKFRAKRANALRTGYTWTITFGELDWPKMCPILNIELDYFAETCQENSPSFDRIDSNIGYEKGNVHIISWRANRIKNNGTAEEHRKIANYLDNLTTTSLVKQENSVV